MEYPRLRPEQIERYRREGVVHLPQVFDESAIEGLRKGIAENLAAPSPRFEARTVGDSSARYSEDFWVWSEFPEFESFVRESPAGALGAELLQAERINLVMDNWFHREAGAVARAPWHHDVAYFDFEGPMCVLWIPLEDARANEGISFVRGSHLWDRLFMRVLFDGHREASAPGVVKGLLYESPPAIDENPDAYDLVSFDVEAGDCLAFDIRMLHGSPPGFVPARTTSRYTLRLAHQDARIRYRGDWAAGERTLFEAAGHREGDSIDSAFFPRLWPKSANGPND